MAIKPNRVGVNPKYVGKDGEVIGVGGGNTPSEEYTEAEQLIGKWVDGSPLYRAVVVTTAPTTLSESQVISSFNNVGKSIKSLTGIVHGSNNVDFEVNFYGSTTNFSYLTIRGTGVTMITSTEAILNQTVTLIIEYTKN